MHTNFQEVQVFRQGFLYFYFGVSYFEPHVEFNVINFVNKLSTKTANLEYYDHLLSFIAQFMVYYELLLYSSVALFHPNVIGVSSEEL